MYSIHGYLLTFCQGQYHLFNSFNYLEFKLIVCDPSESSSLEYIIKITCTVLFLY